MDSDEVRRQWEERSGEYSPAYYAHYGPDETSETIRAVLDEFVAADASVLELGCSSGRHLAHLFEHGYDDVAGVEVNGEAFDVMEDAYPGLATEGTFYHDSIENVVDGVADGRYDAVFSVETLQHVHPDAAWVFDELVRITDGVLVTAEVESPNDPDECETVERDTSETRDGSSSERDVNVVRGEVPLYYRDWGRVFTERGMEEIDRRAGVRETVRTFGHPS